MSFVSSLILIGESGVLRVLRFFEERIKVAKSKEREHGQVQEEISVLAEMLRRTASDPV